MMRPSTQKIPPLTSEASSAPLGAPRPALHAAPEPSEKPEAPGLLARLRRVVFPERKKVDDSLRDVLEDYIETLESKPDIPVTGPEKSILSNVLGLRDLKVQDVMIPRADIVALDIETPFAQCLSFITARPFSRYPVFRTEKDEIVGTIHIKDILAKVATGGPVPLEDMVREVPIVSPALSIMDLLLLMRESRKHMALVVDEYGGIDGLVTVSDVMESIVGEIDDEFDPQTPDILPRPDGSLIVDARLDLAAFETQAGCILNDNERQSADTLGGFVSGLAGRVPGQGESFVHRSGAVFEVLEADPRRIKRLRVKNFPRA